MRLVQGLTGKGVYGKQLCGLGKNLDPVWLQAEALFQADHDL